MKWRNFRVVRERAGVISPEPCWCLIEYDSLTSSSAAGWLYTGDTLRALVADVLLRWRSDSALVGY